MYPILSHWMVDDQHIRGYDPDRLDRVPAWARPMPASRSGARTRMRSAAEPLTSRLRDWVRRGSLGPVTEVPACEACGPWR